MVISVLKTRPTSEERHILEGERGHDDYEIGVMPSLTLMLPRVIAEYSAGNPADSAICSAHFPVETEELPPAQLVKNQIANFRGTNVPRVLGCEANAHHTD